MIFFDKKIKNIEYMYILMYNKNIKTKKVVVKMKKLKEIFAKGSYVNIWYNILRGF